jgi:hypothetical protein
MQKKGVLLVYSQNDPRSFEALPNWVGEIKQYCSAEVSVMVVSQKSDLEPLVPHEKGRKVCCVGLSLCRFLICLRSVG